MNYEAMRESINENDENKQQTPMNYLWDICGFCDCMDNNVANDLLQILQLLDNDSNNYITELVNRTKLDYKYVHLILNCLEQSGLTEHGTSVRGSWIDYNLPNDIRQKLGLKIKNG